MTLKIKGECEKCGQGLEANGAAMICSYECTFCEACSAAMENTCPNCGGELVRRPRRQQ